MEQQVELNKRDKIKIKLIPAQTPEERNRNIIANVVVEEDVRNGSGLVPFIDETEPPINGITKLQNLQEKSEIPHLRYYAVGASTLRIKCPLCRQSADAAVMHRRGDCRDATCCLSMFSCCFPILWLCCFWTFCGCGFKWTTKGLYCNQCGGKLGIARKPK